MVLDKVPGGLLPLENDDGRVEGLELGLGGVLVDIGQDLLSGLLVLLQALLGRHAATELQVTNNVKQSKGACYIIVTEERKLVLSF